MLYTTFEWSYIFTISNETITFTSWKKTAQHSETSSGNHVGYR